MSETTARVERADREDVALTAVIARLTSAHLLGFFSRNLTHLDQPQGYRAVTPGH